MKQKTSRRELADKLHDERRKADHYVSVLTALALRNGGALSVTHEEGQAAVRAIAEGRVTYAVERGHVVVRVKPTEEEK